MDNKLWAKVLRIVPHCREVDGFGTGRKQWPNACRLPIEHCVILSRSSLFASCQLMKQSLPAIGLVCKGHCDRMNLLPLMKNCQSALGKNLPNKQYCGSLHSIHSYTIYSCTRDGMVLFLIPLESEFIEETRDAMMQRSNKADLCSVFGIAPSSFSDRGCHSKQT